MRILEKPWVRYVILFLVGVGVGAIFYPTKTIKEEIEKQHREEISKIESEKAAITMRLSARLTESKKELKEYQEESSRKTEILKQENRRLKSKVTEKRFKLIKPDGTIEERVFRESETDVVSSVVTSIRSEFDRKVKSIENKWRKIHAKRISQTKKIYESEKRELKKTISSLRSKKEVKVNERNFGASFGVTTRDNYFSSINYDVYGPFFLDLHLESNRTFSDSAGGIGVGVRF